MNITPSASCLNSDGETEIVWISSRLPLGLTPVPRYKHRLPKLLESLSEDDKHWLPVSDPPLETFCRSTRDGPAVFYRSHPATRCQEWSTLRQMLPSRGYVKKEKPERWGVASATLQTRLVRVPEVIPRVNSCMTTFVDDVHVIDPAFKLYTSR